MADVNNTTLTRAEFYALRLCPLCGSALDEGFGLAYGGYGPYKTCNNPDCDFLAKSQEMDDDDD